MAAEISHDLAVIRSLGSIELCRNYESRDRRPLVVDGNYKQVVVSERERGNRGRIIEGKLRHISELRRHVDGQVLLVSDRQPAGDRFRPHRFCTDDLLRR